MKGPMVVLGAGMALLGTGSFILGATVGGADAVRQRASLGLGVLNGTPSAHLDRANTPVNPSARDPLNLDANNSPSLAVNPKDPSNLVVVNRVDTPRFSCGLHVSRDGGGTWEDTAIPIAAGEEPKCYAPDLGFSPGGRLYLSYSTLQGAGNVPDAAWVTSSADGGRTLARPRKVLGPLAFQVRLAVDPSGSDRLYLAWLQASSVGTLLFPDTGNPIEFARSDDGGATWRGPIRVTPEQRARVVAPSLAVGAAGEVYLAYVDLGDDRLDYEGGHRGIGGDPYAGHWRLVLARSLDRGASWAETEAEPALAPTERFIVFLPPFPSVAVDPVTGSLFVGYQDGRSGDSDVYVWTSGDRGATFTAATRVNDTPFRDGTSQYRPQLAVSPAGRLDVLYLDRRSDPRNVFTEVSLQSSYDQARTFTPRLRVSDHRFDSRIGFGEERGMPDLGSRLALHAGQEAALAVWADTRAGTLASGKQDLSLGVVRIGSTLRGDLILRLGGLAMAAVALLIILVGVEPLGWMRRRRLAGSLA